MEDAVYEEFLQLEQTHWWFRGRRAIFIALLDRHVRRDPGGPRLLMDLGRGVGGTLREIHRMLKPGGILIASGPAYQFLYAQQDRITHHVRRYTLGEMQAKARAAGFEVRQASYINFLLFPAILPIVLLLKGWQ